MKLHIKEVLETGKFDHFKKCLKSINLEKNSACDAIFPLIPLPLPSKLFEHMANHKAPKKDVRQATKRRERNRYYGKTTRNAVRDLRSLTDKAAAGEQLPEVISMIDKLAKRGVIHKNKASNLKSKLVKRVSALA